MAELGRAALAIALGLALYAAVAGTYAAVRRRRRLAASAENALLAAVVATAVASLVLAVAFVRNDFSFVYVAEQSSSSLPLGYTLSAFWSGQEGSLLLWLLVLSTYSALAVAFGRRAYALTYGRLDRRDSPNAQELRAVLDIRPATATSAGSRRARTPIPSSSRSRTRSRSAVTCSPARICS